MRPHWTGSSLTLLRVGGVPLRIHVTWLIAAAWMVWMFSADFGALAGAAGVTTAPSLPPLAWGVVLTVALFGCVALHELAHVAVARRGGTEVHAITLMMLGGVSEMGPVEEPRLELLMAAAGPALSLALGGLFLVAHRLAAGAPADVRFGLFYLAQINLVLGVFNLLPAFPMDGGRMLRSALVRPLGRVRATRVAATIGKILAVALAAYGLLNGSVWLALIALFLFTSGDAEARALETRAELDGLRVRDAYAPRVAMVPASATVADAANEMLARSADACLVAAETALVGAVTAEVVRAVPVRERTTLPLTQLIGPVRVVDADAPLLAVLRRMDEERLQVLAVRVGDGIGGTLDRSDIARLLQARQLLPARG